MLKGYILKLYSNRLKPLIDFFTTFILFIILFPAFLALTTILVIANSGSPFFTQVRPGKNEKYFRLIKFRTMNNKKDNEGKLLPDVERLTRIGKFVRSTSIDELPQLFNVLKGDMSLIGPRPLLVKYLDRYTLEQAKRHHVKPGITGWAQVNGRNSISWQKKFEYDVYYVENYDFTFDMKILWLTIKKVFKREGINESNSSTMQEFKGNKTM